MDLIRSGNFSHQNSLNSSIYYTPIFAKMSHISCWMMNIRMSKSFLISCIWGSSILIAQELVIASHIDGVDFSSFLCCASHKCCTSSSSGPTVLTNTRLDIVAKSNGIGCHLDLPLHMYAPPFIIPSFLIRGMCISLHPRSSFFCLDVYYLVQLMETTLYNSQGWAILDPRPSITYYRTF